MTGSISSEADRLASENAATPVAIPDPFRVLLDREETIGKAVQPLLDRHGQLLAGGDEIGSPQNS